MTANDDRFVDVPGTYIQTPESTTFSTLDPRTERRRLEKIIQERADTIPDGLDIVWQFKIKGERKPLASTKSDAHKIQRWQIIELAGQPYVVIDKETVQHTHNPNVYIVIHTLEKFDETKHKQQVTEREQY